MKRRSMVTRVRGLALAVFALFAVLATPAAAAGGGNDAHAFAVRAYADEFKVSPARAASVLDLQARGGPMLRTLRSELGDGFADAWFDNGVGRWVVALSPSGDRGAASRIVESNGLGNATSFVRRAWSEAEVKRAVSALGSSLGPDARAGRVQYGIRDGLTVLVANNASAAARGRIRAAAAAAGVASTIQSVDPSRLAVHPDACNTAATARYCDPPLIAGLRYFVGGSQCTTGFSVTRAGVNALFNLTAGHCVLGNDITTFGVSTAPGAHVVGHDYFGYVDANGDAGMFQTDATWSNYPAWANWPSYPDLAVTGTDSPYRGEFVCHSGANSGTSCGTISAFDQTVTYVDDTGHPRTLVGGLTQVQGTSLCSQGGDSGGPWINPYNGLANGVHDAGPGGVCPTAVAYFTPIWRIASRLGISVNHL